MYEKAVIPIGIWEDEKKYWQTKLSGGLSELRLITDFPGKPYMGKIHKMFLDEEVTGHLRRISKNNDLSLFVFLLASFKVLLLKYTGQDEIIVSSPIYGTDAREYNRYVIFRDFLYPGMVFKEVLMEVKQTVADGYKNQYYPVDKILDLLGKGDKFTINRVVVLFENIHGQEPGHAIIAEAENDIMLSIREIEGKLEAEISYNAGIFKVETIRILLKCYSHILGQVLSNTNIGINHIELANEEEKKEILYNFNPRESQYPQDKTITRLFEEQVGRTPDSMAIHFHIDMKDIFEELESRETNTDLWDRMAKCRFKKNPFIYESGVSDSPGMAGYKLLKTHRHNSVVVNGNMLEVLNLFDSTRSLGTIFSFLQDMHVPLVIYPLKVLDIIELTYEFKEEPERFSLEKKETFLDLVKSMFRHHLIELTGYGPRERAEEMPAHRDWLKEELNTHIPLNSLLNQDKTLSNAPVLFQGDTPGLQTVGLLYMASYLRRNGIKSYCQFYNTDWSSEALKENIKNLLKEIRPEIAAISMKWFPHIARVLEICKIVKEFATNELLYDIKVVVGGNTASYYAKEIIRYEWVDYVIRGDGEKPLLQLCRGEENISNCIYKKDGIIVENPFNYLEDEHNTGEIYLSHLDEIMLSNFAPLPGAFFIYPHKGCGMDCIYCGGCTSANKKIFNRSRLFRRGVGEMRKDICEAKKYTSTFMFDFDAPNVNLMEYCREIWEGIDLKSHFVIFTNLIPPSPELIALVNQTFKYVYWNLDIASLSERHRKQLDSLGLVKPQPNDDEILAVFNECERYNNAEVRISLIAGLPYFTMEDITLSDNMLSRILNRYTCGSELYWGRLHAEPGAPVVENAEKYDMYSLASSFDDFLKYSQMNFNNNYNVEHYSYPYIYFKDEELNSKISNFYYETNIKVEKYKKHKRENINIYHRLSYLELNEKANRLAGVLREQGVTSNPIVGLITRDPREVAIGILGILKAGAAYLPIEPDIPGDRKRYMIEDCNLKILLAGSSCLDPGLLSYARMTVVPLSHQDLESYSGTNLETNFSTSNLDLAYAIYTSGTTGNPRGVLIDQRGLVNYTSWRINTYNLKEKDVTLEPLSYGFDGFASNFYSSLLSGGTLIMVHYSRKGDYQYIREIVKQEGVTNISLVPGMYGVLVDIAEGEDLRSLRFVVLAGERAGKTLLEKSRGKNPGILHINEYGPTEATVTAAARLDMDADNTAVIGRPIANTRIYIVDNTFKIVPPGVPGQLCIEGPGVARGYLNNPGLTFEKFISFNRSYRSYKSYISNKLYQTGDLARWLPEGEIEFLGRIDQQVKIRGFRIELEEIETQLRCHEKVKDAAIMALDISPGTGTVNTDKYLCAYVISEEPLDFPVIKEFLSGKLPGYMIPSYFIQLEKLPLTLNGKLDTKALPLPEIKAECIAPRSEIEKKLVEIWGEVLEISKDKIGINSNFFELGGHSLSANTAAAKIYKEFNVKNFLARIFETPTIKSLAEQIKNAVQDEHPSIEISEQKEYYQLSSAQKRLYVLQQMYPAITGYNIPLVVHLGEVKEKELLDFTFRQLIKRHESLRTSFEIVSEMPVQRIHRAVEFKLESYENPGSRVEDSSADIMKYLDRPFDLSHPPLLRAGLIGRGKKDYTLAINMHHIITDGISMRIMSKDFMRLLKGEELPSLRIRYKDFSQWQDGDKKKEIFKPQEEYWLKEYEGEIPVLNLPTDYPRPVIQSFEGKAIEFQLSAAESSALKALAFEQDSTRFMVLLGIFVILLSKISGQDDVIVGTPIAGRRHVDLDQIVGMFVNTLALRNYPLGEQTYREFLKSVRKKALEAYDNQDYQFEDLVDRVDVNRDTGRNPLFDVMFSFDTAIDPPVDTDVQSRQISDNDKIDRESSYNNYESNTAQFDLSLTAMEINRGLFFSFGYCTKLFKKERIERFINYFKTIVSRVINEPDIKLSEIEIISGEEKNRFLYEFNDTEGEYPKDKTIHRLFEEQVERTPDHAALVGPKLQITKYKLQTNSKLQITNNKQSSDLRADVDAIGEIQLSYGLFNEESNRMAYSLIEKGAQPDTIIGIMIERSVEMIIGILGILKAGGAYMPIEPDYPQERIDYILKDSNVGVLVTTPKLQVKVKAEVEENSRQPGLPLQFIHIHTNPAFASEPSLSTLTSTSTCQVSPANLAYVIYTSGSTGRPKGVVINHSSFIDFTTWAVDEFEHRVGCQVLLANSYASDGSIQQIFPPLISGGTLHLIDMEIRLDMVRYLDYLKKNRINNIEEVPVLMKEFLTRFAPNDREEKLPDLTCLILSSEYVPIDLVKKCRQHLNHHGRIINAYGPTEASVDATTYHFDGTLEGEQSLIGKPRRNLKVYILDKTGHCCPIGVRGEICISGVGLARGYLNRPELTAEKFCLRRPGGSFRENRPLDRETSTKSFLLDQPPLYRTGDRGSWLPDGNIRFIGRIDYQIKIRGYRVELQEIENVFKGHKEIKDAVVVTKENTVGEIEICAYYIPKTGTKPSLPEYIQDRLPSYMIPSYLIELEKIPLTPNGKIDKNTLPQPAVGSSGEYLPPRNEIEKKLMDIWSEVLNRSVETIGIHTDFFKAGGHSLKVAVLTSRIQKQLEVEIPIVQVFKTPTISGLAEYLKTTGKIQYTFIEPVELRQYYDLTPVQKRLYILQQLAPDSPTYNVPAFINLDQWISKETLIETFKKIIQRHEILRTSYEMVHDEPRQKVHDNVEFEIEISGRGDPAWSSRETIESIIKSFIRPFDLSKAPLIRVGLIKDDEDKTILAVDMHHIISDLISHEVLSDEFNGLCNGEKLPGLKLQYKDYAGWQNSEIQQLKIKQQETYWLNLLSGDLSVLELPVDFPRPQIQSFEGTSVDFILEWEEIQRLKNIAQHQNVTHFMIILAVFNVLLSKLSGQEDIIVGTPISTRQHEDIEEMIGMFVNTLALRNEPVGYKTFSDFLQELKIKTLAAYDNADYPFEELVDKIVKSRDTSRNPLFDVMFNYFHEPGALDTEYKEEKNIINWYGKIISKFDLSLTAVEYDDNLLFNISYCTRLFKAETIDRIIGYFKKIITLIIKDTEKQISGIEIISEREKKQILFDFNDTTTDYPKDKSLHGLFDQQVERTPDHTAIFGRGRTRTNTDDNMFVTYRVLNEQSNQLAILLIDKGVRPDTIVGLMAERCIETILGILGILMAGGAFLPIELGASEGRVNHLLKDSQAGILLNAGHINITGEKIIDGQMRRPATTAFYPAKNLAYLIYTSGSTGRPKGVGVQHRSLVNYSNWFINQVHLKPGQKLLLNHSFTFDAAYTNVFSSLIKDCQLHIPTRETYLDPKALLDYISTHRITHLKFIPSLFAAIANHPALPRQDLKCIRFIMLGGEAIRVNDVETFHRSWPHIPIMNHYGPTETTIGSIARMLDWDTFLQYKQTPTIGQPIDNTRVYIMDREYRLTAIGISGELCISGVGLARGYLNQQELTLEKFDHDLWDLQDYHDKEEKITIQKYNKKLLRGAESVNQWVSGSVGQLNDGQGPSGVPLTMTPRPHPETNENQHHRFAQHIGSPRRGAPGRRRQKIYRTGDLARWLPNGNIELLGRIDHQVKIRGVRVELGEIESRLLNYPGLREVVVLVREDMREDKYICAYFVSDSDYGKSELREYLLMALPDYMIPSYFVWLEKIPLTPNGKLDRKALPAPEVKTGKNYIAPRNEIEKKLMGIWSGVLGIEKEKIGMNDNFFHLGGHSLKATVLISRIHKELNINVPLTVIFKTPYIHGLAAYIKKTTKSKPIRVEPVEKKEYYYLSSAQRRLYILQQMDAEKGIAYNMPSVWQIEGYLDVGKLEMVFQQLILRYESLRTFFTVVNDEQVQRIKYENYKFRITKYKQIPNDKFQMTKTIKEFIRPFDLSQAPLLRVELIKLPNTTTAVDGPPSQEGKEDEYILMVDMHHIISDGLSIGIFIKEVMELYGIKGLPALKLHYKDYSEWHNKRDGREFIKEQENYWLKRFEGELPVLELMVDYPRPLVQSFVGRTLNFEFNKEKTAALKSLARERDVTLFMLLLSVYTVFLSKLSGQEDIVVGTPIANRRHANLESIIGMFVNTLALRNFPVMEKTFKQFLKEIKENTIKAFENQDYLYEDLVEQVEVERDTGRNPLFDTMFALQNMDSSTVQIPGLAVVPYEYESRISKFDLTLMAVEIEDHLAFTFEYCTSLFKKETIRRFIGFFKKTASTVLENRNIGILEIDIIIEEEKNLILLDFNDTAAEYPRDKTIHQLFAEQVQQRPDNIAVIGEMQSAKRKTPDAMHCALTYRELNEQSNQLANLLRDKGITIDCIVGIMVEQYMGMIIGILSILKAGGAYLPIDPDYPEERTKYMLDDSGAQILLKLQGHSKWMTSSPEAFKNDPRGACFNLYPAASNRQLAYIIYTSGSTGQPRGVLVDHHALVNLCTWHNRFYSVTSRDRASKYAAVGFDASVWEIFPYLLAGASLYLVPGDIKLDMTALNCLFEAHDITISFLPTPVCERFMELENHSLHSLLTGGDRLSRFIKRNYQLFNNYGPTENTVVTTACRINQSHANIPIGKPIHNNLIFILSPGYCHVQPVGVSGELCIGGESLARGYLNNPGLTAEKFIKMEVKVEVEEEVEPSGQIINTCGHTNKKGPDKNERQSCNPESMPSPHHPNTSIPHSPHSPHSPYSTIYKTGDLARWLADGNIEFIRRIDQQVKICGMRIELGEIENKLSKHEKIKEFVVMSRQYQTGDNYLCVYIVPNNEFIISELREYLAKELPDYMIPAYFMTLEKIPLTPNGKIDRKALPKPQLQSDENYVAPRDDIETKLVEIWSEILDVEKEKISITANFFHLGGHSLKATVLLSRIHEEFNIRLLLSKMFQSPTIKKLAKYITTSELKDRFTSIHPVEKKEYYPLISPQNRLYMIQQQALESTAYNMPQIIPLNAGIDIKIEEAAKQLIERHESFRTSFEIREGKPVQRIHDEVEFEIEYYDLQVTGAGDRCRWEQVGTGGLAPLQEESHHLSFIIQHSFIRPFELSQAPLLRVGLLTPRDTQQPHLLLVDMHHIISDGVSMNILKDEFFGLCSNEKLPGLPIQYKDFAYWQNSKEQLDLVKQQETYWLEQFQEEIPLLELPVDYERSAPGTTGSLTISVRDFTLGERETKALRTLAKEEKTTLFMVLLTAFTLLLSKISGQEDIVVGIGAAGRRHADLQRIIGMFVNTLAVRNYPGAEKTYKDFLNEVNERTLQALENQEYPFEELVEKVVKERIPHRNPLVETIFTFDSIDDTADLSRDQSRQVKRLNPESYEYVNTQGSAKFDIIISGLERDKGLLFFMNYRDQLFKKETIQVMIDNFKEILAAVIKDKEIHLKEIALSHGLSPIKSNVIKEDKGDFEFL